MHGVTTSDCILIINNKSTTQPTHTMNIKKVTQELNPNYTKGGFYKKVLGYKVETESSTYFIQSCDGYFQLHQARSFEETCTCEDNHIMDLSTKADCLWTIENQF